MPPARLLVCGVFNFLGLWPFGAFRTNLFALSGVSAMAALGVDRTTRLDSWWRAVLPVTVCVLLPLALFERSWNSKKATHGIAGDAPDRRAPGRHGRAAPPAARAAVLAPARVQSDTFYTRYHPALAELRPEIARYFEPIYAASAAEVASAVRALPPGGHTWVVMTRRRGVLPRDLDVEEGFRRGQYDVYPIRTE